MAYFAVAGEDGNAFEIRQCHINVWCLGGILGHNNFFWDVGLRLKGNGRACSKLSLALPFGSADDGVEDLADRLLKTTTAELVFGNPVSIEHGLITYDKQLGGARLVHVDSPKRLPDKSGPDHSVWEIGFQPPLDASEGSPDVYLRLRFRMGGLGNTWAWRRSGFRNNGALVDLRISDVREATQLASWRALRERIVEIKKLNLLVITPEFLQLKSASPALQYMRLLESRAWEDYLGQVPNLGKGRLIVYHWRTEENKPANVDRPFLAFLDLCRDNGFHHVENHVRSALVLIVLVWFGRGVVVPSLVEGSEWFLSARSWWASLSIAGVPPGVYFLWKHWPRIMTSLPRVRRAFLSLERWLLRPS